MTATTSASAAYQFTPATVGHAVAGAEAPALRPFNADPSPSGMARHHAPAGLRPTAHHAPDPGEHSPPSLPSAATEPIEPGPALLCAGLLMAVRLSRRHFRRD